MKMHINEFRVAVVGTNGVGKTSLIKRFIDDCFNNHYTPTIGDSYLQTVQLPSKYD